MTFSADGSWFAAGWEGGLVKVWDVRRRVIAYQFRAADPWCFSVDGKRLLTASEKDDLVEWDLSAQRKTRSWPLGQQVWQFSADQDLRWSVVATRGLDAMSLLDLTTGAKQNLGSGFRRVLGLGFSSGGSLFAASSYLGYIRVWETSGGREVCTLGGGEHPLYSVCFSPDQTRLLTTYSGRDSIQLYDLASRLELVSIPAARAKTVEGGFSPDGAMIGFRSSFDLYILRAPSWKEIAAAETKRRSEKTRP